MVKEPFGTIRHLQHWFGDRGQEIERRWVKNWTVQDELLYVEWSDKAPAQVKAEEPFDCVSYYWKSIYLEDNDYHYFGEIKGDKK
jgi:hypothetical protein